MFEQYISNEFVRAFVVLMVFLFGIRIGLFAMNAISISSLNFKAYFYIDSFENRFGSIDKANARICNLPNRNKISTPSLQMDVYLKK